MAATLQGLGECIRCKGHLCISGKMVTCENCGHKHTDHPVTKAWAKEQPKTPDRPCTPMDYVHTYSDRIMQLEKLVAQLQSMVNELARPKKVKAQPVEGSQIKLEAS